MSKKMEPCALCGSDAIKEAMKYWNCSNDDCLVMGPNDDLEGEGWNRLMRREPTLAGPKPGTVRVRIGVWLGANGIEGMLLPEYIKEGDRPDAWITADIPFPQAAEVVGTVGSTE